MNTSPGKGNIPIQLCLALDIIWPSSRLGHKTTPREYCQQVATAHPILVPNKEKATLQYGSNKGSALKEHPSIHPSINRRQLRRGRVLTFEWVSTLFLLRLSQLL